MSPSLAQLGEVSKDWSRKHGESDEDFAARKRRNNSALIGGGIGSVVATPLVGGPIGATVGWHASKHKTRKNRKES